MSDDTTNSESREGGDERDRTVDFGDEFGVVRFADEDQAGPVTVRTGQTDQVPHWSEPPTGEVPRALDPAGSQRAAPPPAQPPTGARGPGRVVIGADGSGSIRLPADERATRLVGAGDRGERPAQVRRATRTRLERRQDPRSDSGTSPRPTARGTGRDLPTAVAVGALLAAAFVATLIVGPAAVMVLLCAVIGLASVEFFGQLTAHGYRPTLIVGAVGSVSTVLVAYWIGDAAVPLALTFSLTAAAIVFIGADSVESGPLPNLGVSMLGLTWIGLFGAFGALILRLSNASPALADVGTDTLFLSVAAVAANDVGAYFVGAATGRTPLRAWISPSKTMEGLVGGTIATFAIVILVGLQSTTWTSLGQWLTFALVVSVAAPIGDLVESMLKRNLDVKDFGTLLRGHGGALDRFDSQLFVLPFVYYLTLVLTPWAA
jgi:phosphatidate cytidylyltransferase